MREQTDREQRLDIAHAFLYKCEKNGPSHYLSDIPYAIIPHILHVYIRVSLLFYFFQLAVITLVVFKSDSVAGKAVN